VAASAYIDPMFDPSRPRQEARRTGRRTQEFHISTRATDFPYSFSPWIADDQPQNVGWLDTEEFITAWTNLFIPITMSSRPEGCTLTASIVQMQTGLQYLLGRVDGGRLVPDTAELRHSDRHAKGPDQRFANYLSAHVRHAIVAGDILCALHLFCTWRFSVPPRRSLKYSLNFEDKRPASVHCSAGAPGRTRTNTSVRKPDFEAD
jgi:hypothetical protein